MCAPSRNSAVYQDFLQLDEQANPEGTIYVITDNLSSHDSKSTRAWLEDHPRIRHAFIPKGACWLNLQEGWWRIFRRQALAGQSFADPEEIAHATEVATAQLNARARPWIWGRPQPKHAFLPTTLYIHPLRNVALTPQRHVQEVGSNLQVKGEGCYGSLARAAFPQVKRPV